MFPSPPLAVGATVEHMGSHTVSIRTHMCAFKRSCAYYSHNEPKWEDSVGPFVDFITRKKWDPSARFRCLSYFESPSQQDPRKLLIGSGYAKSEVI